MNDPVIRAILIGGGALIIVAILAAWLRRRAESRAWRASAEERRRRAGYAALQDEELQRQAARILATSSSPTIAGFTILRQVEAVFSDGHPNPTRAVLVLKALAAERGGNAIVNLLSERQAGGKCAARGDVVVARANEESSITVDGSR